MDKLRNMRALAKKANEQKYENHSRETLKRHVQTKFKTTMIGALARFEDMFGYLWGDKLDERDLNDEQLEFRKMWNIVRTEILNNGNNQLRAVMSEIEQYTVRYNKMEYKFIVKPKPGQQGEQNDSSI